MVPVRLASVDDRVDLDDWGFACRVDAVILKCL